MGKKRVKFLSVLLSVVLIICSLAFSSCNSSDNKKYTVRYDPNYDGATIRTVYVVSGAHAVDWKPYRDGWEIEGWYTDKACVTSYDFKKRINGNVTLYAYWTKDPDMHRVIFNSNYSGGGTTAKEFADGKRISATDAPEVSRLGFKFEGWYKDKECTDKWAFGYDAVTDSFTLYAGYSYDDSIPRTKGGAPIFENVNIDVWNGVGMYTNETTQMIVSEFNKAYEGKIHVTFSTELYNQDSMSLRLQKTPTMISTYKSYYCLSDVFDLAGISYDSNLWYEKATQDSYVNGKMYSMPLLASTPYIVYNKDLMKKYNGDNSLPDSYSSFSALIKKVYEGEKSNEAFETFISNRGWTFNEVPSSAAFVQNGAPYYVYKDGKYTNDWNDESNFQNAVTGLKNMYSLLGEEGALHGRLKDDAPGQNGNDMFGSKYTLNAVKEGKAFMGLINWSYSLNETLNENKLGIMSISGLYSDGEFKDLIPINTMGLSFYKAAGVSNIELAAGAVFADFVSKNSWRYGTIGYYPVRKSVVESDEFVNSSNSKIQALKTIANPNNFVTLYGHKYGKQIHNTTGAIEFINAYLDGENADTATEVVKKFMYVIVGLVTL